ncbi:MAG TPA: helix-turn-helix domain-containing protein [Blastocatellia bacterium]|nr:helix-turn-helix domain-containing protein [Blastocatellia bacterium]
MTKKFNQDCAVAKSLEIIGDRWTLLIVRDLLRGKTKYRELVETLPGIASNVLSERLKLLEAEGIVSRTFYSDHPPRAEYGLTKKGLELGHVLGALASWGSKHIFKESALIDAECGHEVKIAYYCPVCDRRTSGSQVRLARRSSVKKK